MLGFPVDGHVLVRVQAALLQQVAEAKLRRGALPGRNQGLALQVRHGLDGLPAVLHNVEDAQGVDRQGDDLALRLVVQHRRQVGGDAGDVQLALNELGRQLVGGARQRIAVDAVIRHHADQAHGSGALQRPHPNRLRLNGVLSGGLGGRLLRLDGLLGLGGLRGPHHLRGAVIAANHAAGGQGQGQGQHQGQRFQGFHPRFPPSISSLPSLRPGHSPGSQSA